MVVAEFEEFPKLRSVYCRRIYCLETYVRIDGHKSLITHVCMERGNRFDGVVSNVDDLGQI